MLLPGSPSLLLSSFTLPELVLPVLPLSLELSAGGTLPSSLEGFGSGFVLSFSQP
jgi:hypothetical protein